MPRTVLRTIAALLPAAALALGPVSAVQAREKLPETIPLVTGSLPEGISAGPGTTFFAGSRQNGAVYVGDVTASATPTVLVAGRSDAVAVGLLYDPTTERIWVAGGRTGEISAYDAASGVLLYRAQVGGTPFLNDVAITPDAVYVTDSASPTLFVVPLGPGSRLPAPGTVRALPVTGADVQPATGNGLNGIRVLPTGELIVVSAGDLFTVDATTGVATQVQERGRKISGGDGLVLDGRTLYVVNGLGGNEVVRMRLSKDFTSVNTQKVITDSDFDRPTTGALIGGGLYVVNGQFSKPATEPVEVVRVKP